MKRVHFIVGALGLVVFLLTGQYMHLVYDHLRGMDDAPRMLFRASHIYILLSSVVNLAFGVYSGHSYSGFKKHIQKIVSALVMGAPFFLIAGFFIEPHMTEFARPYTRYGLYALFAAGVLLTILGLLREKG